MKSMLLICRDEQVWDKLTAAERRQISEDTTKVADELTARGSILAALRCIRRHRRPASGCATARSS